MTNSRENIQKDASVFPFPEGGKQANNFIMGYFDRLAEDPEISQVWKDLKTLVQVHLTEPDLFAVIDTRKGDMNVTSGKCKDSPELILTLTADDFHRIYSGQLNVLAAFASQKVNAEGKIAVIMETTWTLPQAIEIYRGYCEGLGLKFPAVEAAITEEPSVTEAQTRTERLRERFAKAPREICIERARLFTESFKKTEGEPQILRQAKALTHVLKNLTINIYPDELIVGNVTSKFLGAGIFPEGIAGRILGELDAIGARSTNPFLLSEEDKLELRKNILPYWKNQTLESRARKLWAPEVAGAFDKIGIFILTEVGGIGHILLNHPKVLQQGLKAIAKEAVKRRKSFQKQGDLESANFCQAASISCEAIVHFAKRHADLAEQKAREEKDAHRVKELRAIAQRCKNVPAYPPTTFAEALQAMLFTQLGAIIESSIDSAFSVGRIDQFLFPFYKQDIKTGQMTSESAQELIECLYLKLSHIIPLFDSDVALAFSGLTTWANAVIGGIDRKGRDATNELSYLALQAMNHIRTPNPTLGARIHPETPPEFLSTACSALLEGMGNLQFLSDKAIIPAMQHRGVPLEEARDYGIIGCVEPAVPGRSFTSSDAALFNLALPVELALNDGSAYVFQEQIGVRTGKPQEFTSMRQLLAAYQKQIEYLVKLMAEGLEGLAQAHAELKPTPFLSAITDDCLKDGKDLTVGGAVYNFTGVQGVGLATAADSLAAIDQFLFQEQRVTWDELLTALSDDFKEAEGLRQLLLTRAPKYGTDNDLADKYVKFIVDLYSNEVSKYSTFRGGTLIPGIYSVTTHIPFGLTVGALPNGRKARTSLSFGVTPSPGVAQKGPTAAIISVAKLNHQLVANGSAFNLRLSPSHFIGKEGINRLQALITTYFKLGGMQLQFNIVDTQTLREAQAQPENYKDLVVRVSGYSALFVDLDRLVQEELIARTVYNSS